MCSMTLINVMPNPNPNLRYGEARFGVLAGGKNDGDIMESLHGQRAVEAA